MTKNISGAESLLGILHQQTLDEILGLGGDVRPVLVRELKLPLLDVFEQLQLTIITLAAVRPGTFSVTPPTEGRIARQKDVHHHPQAPEVAPLVIIEVILRVLNEGLHYLRGHELCAAHRGHQERRGLRAASGVEPRSGAQVKVTELDRSEPISVHTQHVLWLEITMSDSLGVEKLKSAGHVADDVGSLLLREELPDDTKRLISLSLLLMYSDVLPCLDVVQQLAPRNLLEY